MRYSEIPFPVFFDIDRPHKVNSFGMFEELSNAMKPFKGNVTAIENAIVDICLDLARKYNVFFYMNKANAIIFTDKIGNSFERFNPASVPKYYQ